MNCIGPKKNVRHQPALPYNFPEFKELHDQIRNSYKSYPFHCAPIAFAALSANWERPDGLT